MPGAFSYVRNVEIAEPPYYGAIGTFAYAIIPVTLGALELRAQPFIYAPGSADNAIQLIREAQVSLLLGNVQLNQLYRLIDTSLNGVEYTGTTEADILPAIPVVPALAPQAVSTRSDITKAAQVLDLLDNAYNGVIVGPYTEPLSIREQLQQLIDQSDDLEDLDAEQVAELVELGGQLLQILAALA